MDQPTLDSTVKNYNLDSMCYERQGRRDTVQLYLHHLCDLLTEYEVR